MLQTIINTAHKVNTEKTARRAYTLGVIDGALTTVIILAALRIGGVL